MKILSCTQVSVKYDSTFALKDCSFELDAGNFLGVFGENGTGKSTLLKSVAGLIKPNSGTVNFHGIKKNDIGYMAQQTQVQKDFPASVYEVVLSGTLCRHTRFYFYGKNNKKLADKNLELLGIEQLKHKSIQELSGGQRQRVLLARMLCGEAKLFLLDEPMSGLDATSVKQMHDTLKDINSLGATIIMVSHDIENTANFCDKILHLGNNHFFGSREEYNARIA
ncbi:MAG: metal ABC transporter ATP-binding protein [Fibromonadaceae bacterium]|jgi:zinc transport system ATP-binding protein|nr:metal ABC transporter ATP-binding protein [Fibromonadaceae bacterium]